MFGSKTGSIGENRTYDGHTYINTVKLYVYVCKYIYIYIYVY